MIYIIEVILPKILSKDKVFKDTSFQNILHMIYSHNSIHYENIYIILFIYIINNRYTYKEENFNHYI